MGRQREEAWLETQWAVLVSVGLVVGGLFLLAVLVRLLHPWFPGSVPG